MIAGIGVDVAEIARFASWHTFSRAQLRRIFSETEIDYCLLVPAKSAERFAVRFAAREAFFKALCASGVLHIPFLTLCKAVEVSHAPGGAPGLVIDWNMLERGAQKSPALAFTPCSYVGHSRSFNAVGPGMRVLLSLSHANSVAIAMVVLEL